MIKKIQLTERNQKGQISKNESYFYDEMVRLIVRKDPTYWYHMLWGRIRRNALKKIFERFVDLTNKDTIGKKQ